MCLLLTLIDMTQVIMLCVVLVPPQPEGMVFISPAVFCRWKLTIGWRLNGTALNWDLN